MNDTLKYFRTFSPPLNKRVQSEEQLFGWMAACEAFRMAIADKIRDETIARESPEVKLETTSGERETYRNQCQAVYGAESYHGKPLEPAKVIELLNDIATLLAEVARLKAELADMRGLYMEAETALVQKETALLQATAREATARAEERAACETCDAGDPYPGADHQYRQGWFDCMKRFRAAIRARSAP